ncbi:hypothetical protein HMPREF1551_01927 [Capnocytophaga sp. oral taxon 863 str. F0517]|nr:hypothetical protein HMPREF1551_01927 [Capnocytophaga sp. oral taxon 863 str. F0517]
MRNLSAKIHIYFYITAIFLKIIFRENKKGRSLPRPFFLFQGAILAL